MTGVNYQGTMSVMVNGVMQQRPISHYEQTAMGRQAVPVLRSGEIIQRDFGGVVYIYQTGDIP